jgi:Ca2+-binding RTX toxin-like protein
MRRLKMGVLGLTVVALLACAPSAFASTLTKSGSAITWTAASGIDNNTSFSDSDPTTVVINTSDDPVTYDDASGSTSNATPDGDCTDTDGTTDGSASQVTCANTSDITANSLDGNDKEDASSLNDHAITINLGDNGGSGFYCCTGPFGWASYGDNAFGGAKDDTLNGDQGDDFIEGGPGADTINGGDGNDVAFGGYASGSTAGDGGDTLNGGAGQDELHGQNGDDHINGGAGDDNQSFSPWGGTALAGGPGNDTISGGDGQDEAAGGPGDDTINGDAGDDYLTGDCNGLNNCNGGSVGNDTLNGGDGADSIQGDGGGDHLNGDAGDDYLYEQGDGGVDVVRGGDGVDQLYYATDNFCCGNSINDQVIATLDGQANDGYHNMSGYSQPDDPTNDFGGADVEWLAVSSDNAPTTANGNDAANVINIWGNGADTVDPGLGADNVYTSGGNDTVNAVDGYPDTVDCGDGVDTANVDQFDQVIRCETVTRATVASAYDTPKTPEDLPPTVGWVTPTQNKALASGAKTTLEVNANDDHGVSKVEFYVGQRLVCTDTAAPYQCAYQPIGADLGRNTLVAIAYDTAGQTSAALNSVTVPRFVPKSISAKTTPKKDGKVPYTFKTSGRVLPATGVTNLQGCTGGHVTIAFRAGKKTVSSRRVATKANCTYSSSVTFRIPSRLNPSKLTVLVRFLGSSVLGPRSHKSYSVKVG